MEFMCYCEKCKENKEIKEFYIESPLMGHVSLFLDCNHTLTFYVSRDFLTLIHQK